jgi:subtilisin family serine protease
VANQITSDSPSVFILQWSDALGSSGNDYDLYLLDASMSTVLSAGNDFQDGDDWPIEGIDSQSSNDQGNVLVVLKWSGDDRMLHLNTNRGRLEHGTDGQTAGHAAARGAFGVAAVDWWETQTSGNPNPFDGSESVETFSSDGPRRVHYLADGTPITPGDYSSTGGELRQKPDIAAADGVSTATPGFNPFFGTSAAAPHAAAIGALMLDLDPTLTPDQVRAVFNATALDIEAPGFDRDSGAGIIMADDVLGALSEGVFADGFESGSTSAWTDTVPD